MFFEQKRKPLDKNQIMLEIISGISLPNLSKEEVREVFTIFEEEISKVKSFEHTIKKEDIITELMVFLNLLNSLGGLNLITEKLQIYNEQEYSIFQDYFVAELSNSMKDRSLYYFNENKGNGARNWYENHLLLLTTSLFRHLYNKKLI